MVNNTNVKEIERMSRELSTIKKELDDMKEIVRGLVQFIMKREELDEDEYN